MKKLILFLVIILLYNCKPTDVTIVLTVDTEVLYNIPTPPTQPEIANNVEFSDDNKRRPKMLAEPEFFKTKAYDNLNVTWVGISESPYYTVAIDSIEAETKPQGHLKKLPNPKSRNQDLFGTPKLIGRGGPFSIIRYQIPSNETGLFEYALYFSIHVDSTNISRDFKIDPKLKVR